MEVSRLLSLLYLLEDDLTNLEIPKKLSTLDATLEELAGSPSELSLTEAFTKATDALREALPQAKTNEAAGSIRLALKEIGLDGLSGSNLLQRITKIIDTTPFLLPKVAQQIAALEKEVRLEVARLTNARVALENLNFVVDEVQGDEYEIGVLMPSSVTKDDLRVIKKELDEWVQVINFIQELVTGQPATSIPVRSMSSGSLDLFCGFHASGAEAMMILSLGAYAVIQFVRDAQRRRKEMEDLRYPETVIKPMQEHEKSLIDIGKKDIVGKLLAKKSKDLPANREHELETALGHAVMYVLRRINQGVDIDISTPPEAEKEREEAKAEVQQIKQRIEQLRIEARKITAQLPDRSVPILQLPEPEDASPAIEAGKSQSEKEKHPPKSSTKK